MLILSISSCDADVAVTEPDDSGVPGTVIVSWDPQGTTCFGGIPTIVTIVVDVVRDDGSTEEFDSQTYETTYNQTRFDGVSTPSNSDFNISVRGDSGTLDPCDICCTFGGCSNSGVGDPSYFGNATNVTSVTATFGSGSCC